MGWEKSTGRGKGSHPWRRADRAMLRSGRRGCKAGKPGGRVG